MDWSSSFLKIQTETGWGKTLASFADWSLAALPAATLRTLDIGCGPGLLPALLTQRGCRALGVDLDFIPRVARLHPHLAQADTLSLPLAPGLFNLVTASNVLFLLPDPQSALAEMRRMLRPGGRLALLNPSEHMSVAAATALAEARRLTGLDRDSLLNWARRAEANRRWSSTELRQMLEKTGFQVLDETLRIGPGLALWIKAIRIEQDL